MKLNRREFVRIGTVGAAGVLTSSCGPFGPKQTGLLTVRIQGLCFVERLTNAINVHLVDGNKVSMGVAHEARLVVPDALVDASTTAPSTLNPADQTRVFDLTGKNVTMPPSGTADLKVNADPLPACTTPAAACIPGDHSWGSVKFAADLLTLCGSNTIKDPSKFYGSLLLEHGELHAVKPDSQLGQSTIWTFFNGTQQIAQQVMTDTLHCDVPVSGSLAVFNIGAQKLVLNVGSMAVVTLKNLPPSTMVGVCKATPPCVDHLASLYEIVDAKFTPTVKATMTRPLAPGAEPDYCPPGA